jgi:photosystem II stability/assembly factor-like uncharacterized protein
MDYQQRRRLSWFAIAVLSLPAFVLFGYSLLHPAAPVKAGSEAVAYRTDKPATPDAPRSPWVMQESGTTAGLRGIYSADGKVAWASGTGGTVLKTVDGGEHWTKCAVPNGAADDAALDFRGVQAWDANTAIVMASGPGENSRLYKTDDGCATWKNQTKADNKRSFWDAIVFQHGDYGYAIGDAHTGILIGDPIDGKFETEVMLLGRGWFIDSAGCQANQGEAAFAASNSSIFVFGSRRYVLGTGGTSGAYVLISPLVFNTDGSEPCRRVKVPIAAATASAGIFSISFRDLHHGVAVGGDYQKPTASNDTVASTTDTGLHWKSAAKPPHGYRSSVAWNEELEAWITVGTNGSDISRDDGKTWQPLDDGKWNALSLPFVVGPNGRIARLSLQAKK